MKKSIWIFLLAVLAPGIVLGWLALRSAEEQQIIFERRTAELYQKEADNLAEEVRKVVEAERRSFGDVVHRLLANGDAEALAKDFTYTLADAWSRKAVGFAISGDGQMLSPTAPVAAGNAMWRDFLWNNGAFLSGTKPAVVYAVPLGNAALNNAYTSVQRFQNAEPQMNAKPALRLAVADQAKADEQNGTGGKMLVMKERSRVNDREDSSKSLMEAPAALAKATLDAGQVEQEIPRAASKKVQSDALHAEPDALAPQPAASEPMPKVKAEAAMERSAVQTPPPPALAAARSASEVPKAGGAPARPSEVAELSTRAAVSPQKARGEMRKEQQAPSGRQSPVVTPEMESQRGLGASQQAQADAFPFAQSVTQNRMVEPLQQIGSPTANWSAVIPATADFSTLTGWSDEGMVSRFVQDELELIFWIRPPEAPDMVFGCLVKAEELDDLWAKMFGGEPTGRGERAEMPFVMSLLDDKARPVATRPAAENGRDWTRPFVASEIGEMLPHWEAALYLATPTAIIDSARGFRRTLSFTIVGAVALIALGGWLVVADVRRQLALAQQKTDFVSNVSHELKTPLTSIRMFAELLHDRPPPQEKQGQYLRIITVEAERLTRLINNVLDFAKLERKQRHFEKKSVDLHEVIERVWEGHEVHLREAGFVTKWEAAPGPYPVIGDEDALAQILVNLLSNAEKYSTEAKEIELVTWIDRGFLNVSVLDRGLGVPEGEERKIFEAFYRAHDSLSSGIQGSGLGLTLACRLAAEHGGEVRFERRAGGGSRFTLRVPLTRKIETTDNL